MSGLAEAALKAAQARTRSTDSGELRARGIVPTPVALAAAALARVDVLLQRELGLPEGLASTRVVVLDPAVGTGVWLAAALELTRARGQAPALIGIDLDAAVLRDTQTLLAPEVATQRGSLRLECANTLALAAPFADDDRVRVIVGNPPWAARSASRGCALSDRWLEEFRRDGQGAPLGERRAGVLSDDYVRFVRWALEQARMAPAGALVCFATNASFLDGPVHRGMRAALVQGFDRLEIVDLGGNALLSRGEAGSAARDENVFGVRVGAALSWAVRSARAGTRTARVSYARVTGTRAEKLRALGDLAIPESAVPCAPWFALRPRAITVPVAGFSLAEAFPFHREGVQTNRDAIAIAPTHAELHARLIAIAEGELALPAARHFDPAAARARLARALAEGPPPIAPLAYRPLDQRVFVTLAPLCHRPRGELLRAVAHAPVSLVAVRKERGDAPFNLFGVVRGVADACYLSTRSSCRTRVFPSHAPDGGDNVAKRIAEQLGERGCACDGRALIAYALAVLGSPRHRAAHDAALKSDYAWLPWPRSSAHFAAACAVGEAFIEALCGPRREPSAAATPFVVCAPLSDMRIDPGALAYDAASGQVTCAGQPLLAQVEAAWWQARVGHHAMIDSGLGVSPGTVSLMSLIDVLTRAAAWTRAEARADALFTSD